MEKEEFREEEGEGEVQKRKKTEEEGREGYVIEGKGWEETEDGTG